MNKPKVVVVCPNLTSFRVAELVARYYGYKVSSTETPGNLLGEFAKLRPLKAAGLLLYLNSADRLLAWDHNGIGYEGKDLLTIAIQRGYRAIYNLDALLEFLDPVPQTIKLNEEHSAIVSKSNVKVGCQTFSHEVILKVADAVRAYQS